MKRIDPVSVALYYLEHPDVKPIRSAFVAFADVPDEDEDENYDPPVLVGCCGLASQYLPYDDRNYTDYDLEDLDESQGAGIIADELGLARDYAFGFVRGWDDITTGSTIKDYADEEAYVVGRVDGLEAYEETTRALTR